MSSGGTTGPVLLTNRFARPPADRVTTSIVPPGALWRNALSTSSPPSSRSVSGHRRLVLRRGWIRLKTSTLGLLSSRDEHVLGETCQIGRLPLLETAFARREREEGINELLLLITERQGLFASRSQFCRSGVGSARATCSSVRWPASGVRSSCEAFATKWRCDSNEASRRPKRSSSVLPSSLSSSSGPSRPRRCAGWLRRFRGRGIHLAQRSQEPSSDEPCEPERDQNGEQSHDGGSDVEVMDGEEPSPTADDGAPRFPGAALTLLPTRRPETRAPRQPGRRIARRRER